VDVEVDGDVDVGVTGKHQVVIYVRPQLAPLLDEPSRSTSPSTAHDHVNGVARVQPFAV
jgi:hypothetical protein